MLIKTEEEFYNYISKVEINNNTGILILIAEKSKIIVEELISRLNKKGLVFWGGIFPYVISDDNYYDDCIIVQNYPIINRPLFIDTYNCSDIDYKHLQKHFKKGIKPLVMVLVPGMKVNTSHFLFNLFNKFGNSVKYIGGGAGSLNSANKKCIFCNDGFKSDSYLLSFIDLDVDLEVNHGWEEYYEPLIATKTEDGIIKELNWLPAYDVYKNIILEITGKELSDDNFYELSQKYPLGMEKNHSKFIVKAILGKTKDGDLITSDYIAENSILYLLLGNKETLLEASKFDINKTKVFQNKYFSSIVFNCVSRLSILNKCFKKELSNINISIKRINPNIKTEGIITLGEISHNEKGYLDFYNISIVRAITKQHEEIDQ